jgi:hypothetical protein
MKKIILKVAVSLSIVGICFLTSCTSSKYYLNLNKDKSVANNSVQIDVAGVTSAEYKKLKDIDFESYWQLAFVNKNFPKIKESFFFEENTPDNQVLEIGHTFWKKSFDAGAEYLIICAYLSHVPDSDLEKYSKDSSWKIIIPMSHNDWWGLADDNININISKNKIKLIN